MQMYCDFVVQKVRHIAFEFYLGLYNIVVFKKSVYYKFS